jgi:hypothetical protein
MPANNYRVLWNEKISTSTKQTIWDRVFYTFRKMLNAFTKPLTGKGGAD